MEKGQEPRSLQGASAGMDESGERVPGEEEFQAAASAAAEALEVAAADEKALEES